MFDVCWGGGGGGASWGGRGVWVVVVVVSERCKRRWSVYVHKHITTMHQSLRLFHMGQCLCDELLPPAKSRQPPPTAVPTVRALQLWNSRAACTAPLPGASRCATTGMSNPTKNCTRTCGITAVCCTVCTVDASL